MMANTTLVITVFNLLSGAEDRKLFVGGLSWETREPQLKEYFERFGEVESVNLKMDPMTGKSRCFAFVVYKEPAHLQRAFAAGEHAINSKKVDVKRARAKPGKIFVGGLKPDMTDEDIRTHFEQVGGYSTLEFAGRNWGAGNAIKGSLSPKSIPTL